MTEIRANLGSAYLCCIPYHDILNMDRVLTAFDYIYCVSHMCIYVSIISYIDVISCMGHTWEDAIVQLQWANANCERDASWIGA